MLSCLANLFTGTPRNPSALLAAEESDMIYVMHLIPEDGEVEMWGTFPKPAKKFRRYGAVEVSRELLGTTAYHDSEEGGLTVICDFADRARKQLSSIPNVRADDGQGPGTSIPLACLVEEVLRPVGLEFLSERRDQVSAQDKDAPREFSVFIIHISRSRPGPIWTEAALRSIAR